jgi:hypothetical protein
MKSCSRPCDIREMQIEMTEGYHYTPIKMIKIQNTKPRRCGATGILNIDLGHDV